MSYLNEPYPNIGDVLHRLADIADTKSLASKGHSRYRKEEDFSSRKTVAPTLIADSVHHLFYEPLVRIVSEEFASFFSDCIWIGLSNYIELIKLVPMEGVAQYKVAWLLNKHLAVEVLASIILKVSISQMQDDVPSFFCDKNPIQTLISFYESQTPSPEDSIKRAFTDNIRTVNKWLSGEEIPNLGHLSNLASWASISCPQAINQDKENLFLARFIASFHKKTQYQFVDTLKAAVIWRFEHGQEPIIDLGQIFHKFYIREITSSNLHTLSREGNELHQLLKRSSHKPAASLEAYTAKLRALEVSVINHGKEEELRYHSEWLWGRIFTLSGKLEKALEMYARAVESSLYKSADNMRFLFKEALAVAAIQTKPHKPTMKKLKSRALTFYPKIIEPYLRDMPVQISDEDIDSWRLWFVMRFPQSGWFEEGKELLLEHLKSLGLDRI